MNRLPLFPITATIEDDTLTLAGHSLAGHSLAGHSLAALADESGTPLYVYDRARPGAAVVWLEKGKTTCWRR